MASSSWRPMALVLNLVMWLTHTLLIISTSAKLPKLEHSPKSKGSLSLLAVGDWGRKGDFNQSRVAYQMGIVGQKLDIDFVISVGDNFYDSGLTGVNDNAFKESFSNIYTAKSLQKTWYSILGNHDYKGDVLAQLDPNLRKVDSRWICMRSFMVNSGVATFFFVDTTPFVMDYWKKSFDWRQVAPREQYIKKVLKDLESALKESKATWKLVIGHHTIRSVGKHGDTEELVKLLLPLLMKYGVDFYVNGHDHSLGHISSANSPIQFLTSGGGSRAWSGVFKKTSESLRFFYDGQGFMSLRLTKRDAEIMFYNVYGRVLHRWRKTK